MHLVKMILEGLERDLVGHQEEEGQLPNIWEEASGTLVPAQLEVEQHSQVAHQRPFGAKDCSAFQVQFSAVLGIVLPCVCPEQHLPAR